jgi:molybdate transport system substrate-binding protein
MMAQAAVLSAGAVKPALVKVVEAFRSETGDDVRVVFATAPEIRKRLEQGESWDVVIAPPDVIDGLPGSEGADAAERVTVGRIGIGAMVRSGAPAPSIATIAEFNDALRGARALFYNRASTGLYLDALFERLGIADQLRARTTRYADAGPVIERISKAEDGEIGFGATTVIVESKAKGITFVGPLPAEIQNYTVYQAAVAADHSADSTARKFIRYLTSAEAKRHFAAAGIE